MILHRGERICRTRRAGDREKRETSLKKGGDPPTKIERRDFRQKAEVGASLGLGMGEGFEKKPSPQKKKGRKSVRRDKGRGRGRSN